ncbi:MAG: hypothetical protein KDD67_03490 [Ignavibacteriae bacterium]|nr:hypothetical protein [Ignavibacteriota bacterium]MCB9215096.1 hypothetical protein [Ignavibacteria bacterium]
MHISKTLTESENNLRFLVCPSRLDSIDIQPLFSDRTAIRPSTRSTPAVVVPAFERNGEVSKVTWNAVSFSSEQISITGISLPTYPRAIHAALPEQERPIFGGREGGVSVHSAGRSFTEWMP